MSRRKKNSWKRMGSWEGRLRSRIGKTEARLTMAVAKSGLANGIKDANRMVKAATKKIVRRGKYGGRLDAKTVISQIRKDLHVGSRRWTRADKRRKSRKSWLTAKRGTVKRMGGRTYVSAGFGAWNEASLLRPSKKKGPYKKPYRKNAFEHNLSHHAHVSRATGMIPMPYDRLEAGDTSCAKGYTRLGFSRVCAPKKSSYQARREMYDEDWAEKAMTPNRRSKWTWSAMRSGKYSYSGREFNEGHRDWDKAKRALKRAGLKVHPRAMDSFLTTMAKRKGMVNSRGLFNQKALVRESKRVYGRIDRKRRRNVRRRR